MFRILLSTLQNVSIIFFPIYTYGKSFIIILQYIYRHIPVYTARDLHCRVLDKKDQSNLIQNSFNQYFKNHNSLFHPIKSVRYIHTKVREGKSGHLNRNAHPLYLHLLYFQLVFSYITPQELHYLLD